MKITPVAASIGQVSVGTDEGRSAGADRMAKAKAIAAGQEAPKTDPTRSHMEIASPPPSITSIKMKTNHNTTKYIPQTAETTTQSDTLATIEQTPAAAQAQAPQDPQFAALAKEKRALQAMKREIDAQKAALAAKPVTEGGTYTKEQLQANALRVLQEAGVTYDQLRDQLLTQTQSNPEIDQLRTELKALKEGIDKAQVDRDQAQEQQVLAQIQSDVNELVAQGDEFAAVRTAKAQKEVVNLIHRVWQKGWPEENLPPGTILDSSKAAQYVDDFYIDEYLPFAQLKKVQSRLSPPAEAPQAQPAPKQSAANTKTMRTLTNRDGVSAISPSRRERAIAAMEGRLKA